MTSPSPEFNNIPEQIPVPAREDFGIISRIRGLFGRNGFSNPAEDPILQQPSFTNLEIPEFTSPSFEPRTIRDFRDEQIQFRPIFPDFPISLIEDTPEFQRIGGRTESIFELGSAAANNSFDFTFETDPLPVPIEKPQLPDGLSRAKTAGKQLSSMLARTLGPLVDAFRGNAALRSRVEATLHANPQGYKDTSARYMFNTDIIERQRGLSLDEFDYVARAEEVSVGNPYIVAAGSVAPEVTNVVLDGEFARRSRQSRENFPSGSRHALVCVGDGPHGVIASSALLLERPDLSARVPFISKAKTPGGVFQIPNGKAHELNSKRPNEFSEPFELPRGITDGTLIGEGGIFPQAPGQRNRAGRGRTGSINRLAPYMPAPEANSPGKLYITNWQIALAAKEQAALTMPGYMGEMKLSGIELGDTPGEFRLVMQDLTTGKDYELFTPNVLLALGLGNARRSVVDTPEFRQILEAQEQREGLPLYSEALEAFNYISDRTKEKQIHGKRIAIIGSGDSAATLLEALASQIEDGNFDHIEELYVLANSEVSERKRYSRIEDLLQRRGRNNILRYVRTRVSEIEGVATTPGGDFNQVALIDEDGALIALGNSDTVDHVIDATGFEKEARAILRPILRGLNLQFATQDITLAANPFVAVGQVLREYPGISIVGTAADPKINENKRNEYPSGTQAVLAAVPQNVVAIGIIGPDTTAATTRWLRNRQDTMPYIPINPQITGKTLDHTATTLASQRAPIGRLPAVDNRVNADATLLTPSLLLPMATHRLSSTPVERDGVKVGPGERKFALNVRFVDDEAVVTPLGPVPADVVAEVTAAAADPHFAAYAKKAMAERRSDSVEVSLAYTGGRLSPKRSLVQAA